MSDDGGVLVPIAPSATLDETVAYAAGVASSASDDRTLHLVRTAPGHHIGAEGLERDQELLSEAAAWATAAAEDGVTITTQLLGTDRYIAEPSGHVRQFIDYAREHDVSHVILDPEYAVDATAPTLQSIEPLLDAAQIEYEYAPVETNWVPTRGELLRGGIIFVLAFGFYVGLGGVTPFFNIWTGLLTGLIAAVLLRNVAFERTPNLLAAAGIVARGVVFIPYMSWEIAKANVLFAYVTLHPKLPINPCVDRVDAAVGDGLSVTSFANSITLTPGTLTVDADNNELLVHSLTPGARDDLLDGVHEKAVRFLFYGKAGLELPGPGARGDYKAIVRSAGSLTAGSAKRPSDPAGGDDDD